MMALTYVDDYDDDKDKLDYYGDDDDDADRQTQSWCPWVEMSRPPSHRWSWEECWRPRRERSPHCRRTFRSPVFYINTLLKVDFLWQTHQSGDVLYLVKVERIVARDRAIQTSLWLILTEGCKVLYYSTRDALPWEKKSTWHWDYESLLRRTCKRERPGRSRRDDVEDDDDDVAVDQDDDDC